MEYFWDTSRLFFLHDEEGSTSFVGEFRIVQFSFPKRMSCFWNVAIVVVLPMMGIGCNHRLVKVVLDDADSWWSLQLPSLVRVVVSPRIATNHKNAEQYLQFLSK
jgi:hypothetical protein